MSWVSLIDPVARKQLAGLPKKDVANIISTIELEMQDNPFAGDIVKLGDTEGWRRRVGNYRIKFLLNKDLRLIRVYKIERRTTTTYRK